MGTRGSSTRPRQGADGARRLAVGVCLLLALPAGLANAEPKPAQRPPREPVSWVNAREFDDPALAHHVLDSQALGHQVGYVVATPRSYQANPGRRFPVAVFLHGMGGDESADAAGFNALLTRGAREGVIEECIGLFPNGGRSGYRGAVERMIVDELLPRVDANYRTLTGPRCRVVAGFSMGGQGAVRLSLLHPGLFSAAGSWGGGLWRGGNEILSAVDQQAPAIRDSGLRLLLINGDQDRPDAYDTLVARLASQGVPHRVVTLEDTPHRLGRYHQLSGESMIEFLGDGLRSE